MSSLAIDPSTGEHPQIFNANFQKCSINHARTFTLLLFNPLTPAYLLLLGSMKQGLWRQFNRSVLAVTTLTMLQVWTYSDVDWTTCHYLITVRNKFRIFTCTIVKLACEVRGRGAKPSKICLSGARQNGMPPKDKRSEPKAKQSRAQ